MKPTFQAYLITCVASGRHYAGITSGTLKRRWREHQSAARREPGRTALYRADADAIETLRNGYDPEQENGAPRRSEAFGVALGWQDAIAEEVRERLERQAQS